MVLATLICVLIARMVYLMVFKHDDYSTLSEENRLQTVALAPTRGLIYDRNGVLLATNRTVFSAFATVERSKDAQATVAEVATLLELSEDDVKAIHKRLSKPRRPWAPVLLKLNLSPRERAVLEVNGHRLHGVQVKPETIRHYPFGTTMAHAVGSVRRLSEQDLAQVDERRYRATQFIGKRGVEAFYETSLHGEPGMKSVEVDARGAERRELSRQKPHNGQNLTLHLDSRLQIAASAALGQRRGAVVAIEPATGGIIAMVSNPGYDPNLFVTGIDATQYAELVNSRSTPLVDRATRRALCAGLHLQTDRRLGRLGVRDDGLGTHHCRQTASFGCPAEGAPIEIGAGNRQLWRPRHRRSGPRHLSLVQRLLLRAGLADAHGRHAGLRGAVRLRSRYRFGCRRCGSPASCRTASGRPATAAKCGIRATTSTWP